MSQVFEGTVKGPPERDERKTVIRIKEEPQGFWVPANLQSKIRDLKEGDRVRIKANPGRWYWFLVDIAISPKPPSEASVNVPSVKLSTETSVSKAQEAAAQLITTLPVEQVSIEALAEKIVKLKEQYKEKFTEKLLEFYWYVGKEICYTRVTTDESYRKLAEMTGINYADLHRSAAFYVKYPDQDYAVKAWRQHIAELPAIPLESKPFQPRLYNVWLFKECEEGYGVPNFPGRLPGQLVKNALYYFTEEGETIVDPMAGSGTTYDVCVEMKRKCLAYDLEPIRPYIKKYDIQEGYPAETKDCDFVFLDPPYWSMKENKYSGKAASSMTLNEFYDFIKKLAVDTFKVLKPKGKVAFIIQNQTEKDLGNKPYIDHAFNCFEIFLNAGFESIQRIATPLSTQQFTSFDVERAKKEHRMLGTLRDLIIFRKP